MYLSPYVETFNSNVIKSFVPELRSRKRFSCFGIPMFYVYVIYTNIMNILRTGIKMPISRIHIWLCYKLPTFSLSLLLLSNGRSNSLLFPSIQLLKEKWVSSIRGENKPIIIDSAK